MTIKRPTLSQLQDIAMDFGMDLSSERAREFLALMQGSFNSYEVVEQLPDIKPEVKWPRTPGHQPSAAYSLRSAAARNGAPLRLVAAPQIFVRFVGPEVAAKTAGRLNDQPLRSPGAPHNAHRKAAANGRATPAAWTARRSIARKPVPISAGRISCSA
jgi:hypothetical protein